MKRRAGSRPPATRLAEGGSAALLAATGSLALALGLLVYLTGREASHALLIPGVAVLAGSGWFGVLGHWLPSLVHPFAFSLFTAASLPSLSSWRYGACFAWSAVNVAFEVGQHADVSARLAEVLHSSLGQTALTRTLANYFVRGTFDGGDIVAAVIGALAAAGVLRLVLSISENDHVA